MNASLFAADLVMTTAGRCQGQVMTCCVINGQFVRGMSMRGLSVRGPYMRDRSEQGLVI